jgi:hypothetical protein
MRVFARSRKLVYRGISRNDNHCSDREGRCAPGRVARQPPVCRSVTSRESGFQHATAHRSRSPPALVGVTIGNRRAVHHRSSKINPGPRVPQVIRSTMWGNLGRAPRIIGGGAKNEGVGEHVRTRFHLGLKTTRALRPPVKLRIMRSAPNEENLFLLPDRFSKERTLLKERSSRLT